MAGSGRFTRVHDLINGCKKRLCTSWQEVWVCKETSDPTCLEYHFVGNELVGQDKKRRSEIKTITDKDELGIIGWMEPVYHCHAGAEQYT